MLSEKSGECCFIREFDKTVEDCIKIINVLQGLNFSFPGRGSGEGAAEV